MFGLYKRKLKKDYRIVERQILVYTKGKRKPSVTWKNRCWKENLFPGKNKKRLSGQDSNARTEKSFRNRKKLLDFFRKLGIIWMFQIEDLCNGSTPDSDSVRGGSNPSSSAIRFTQDSPESWGFFFHLPLLKFGFFQIFRSGFLVSLRFSLTRWQSG